MNFDLYRANVKSTVSNSKLKTADRSKREYRAVNNSLREKRHQQEEDGSGKQIALQKSVSFSVCVCSFTIIEDSFCNGLADDVFPSPVSSGAH